MNTFKLIGFVLFSLMHLCGFGQKNYQYQEYQISVKAGLLTVSYENSIDTIYEDVNEEYYFSEDDQEYTSADLERIKLVDSLKFKSIIENEEYYSEQTSHKLLSLVGPYLSYVHNYAYDGGAHPSYGTNFITYNIQTKEAFSLRDFYADSLLFEVLIDNEFILNYVNADEVKTLEELLFAFAEEADCMYRLDLSDFCFGKFKRDQLIVILGLTYNCEVARGNFMEVKLSLDAPENLKKDLKKASKAHLLMKTKWFQLSKGFHVSESLLIQAKTYLSHLLIAVACDV